MSQEKSFKLVLSKKIGFGAQDYQAEMEAFQRKTEQEHIIDWVEQEVVKSITPQLVCLNVIILLLDALYILVYVLSVLCVVFFFLLNTILNLLVPCYIRVLIICD